MSSGTIGPYITVASTPSRSMSARRSSVVVGRSTPGSSTPPRSMAVRRPPCAPAAPLRPPHESQRSLPQTQEGPSAVSTTFGARSRHCAGTRVCQRSFGSHWRSMWSSAEMIRYSIASSADVWRLLVEEAPALVGELVEQRRRPPEITAGLLLERQQPVADRLEPDLIGPEHRAAAIDGPAVAVHPDDVDVARTDRLALLEDLGAFVDHRVEQALSDLVVRDRSALHAGLSRDFRDDPVDLGIGLRRAITAFVLEEAAARLLTETAHLAETIGDGRALAPALADAPADVEAGEIAHGERAHGQAEVGQHLVHLLGRRALEQQAFGLLAALVEHAVADEAVANADQHRYLVDPSPDRHRRGDDRLRRFLAAHDLEQPHDVGRAEEVHADHALGPPRGRGDLVDVERGRVGGQHGARLRHLVEPGEHVLLDGHLLEHRLDDEIGVGESVEVGGALDQAHALLDVVLGQPTLGRRRLVILAHHAEAAIERLPGDLDHRHRNTDVGEVHRDAAAHRAGADHGRLADLRRRRLRGHVGNLGRLALGEEEVTLGLRLRRVERLDEELSLPRQSLVEGQAHRRFHRPDACLRRLEAARLARHRFAELAEDLGLAARGSDLVAEIAHLAQRPLLVDHALGECDGPRGEITADDHRERLIDADETRQALRAAGTRNEAELDLGLAEPRRLHRDAPVTRHRQLEPAAERGAVNGGDDRLRAALDDVLHLGERRLLRRLAEFGDVGAGDERAPGACDDDRGGPGIAGRLVDRVAQALTDVMTERVDRRIVHGHDRDAALTVEADGLADLRHASLVWRRSGANDTRPAPALLRGADVTRGG